MDITQEIISSMKKGVEKAGSQNRLAHILGYGGKNAGCQINYFLCGKRKTIPQEKILTLKNFLKG